MVAVAVVLQPLASVIVFLFMLRRPPRSTLDRSSAASDVYKRQVYGDVPPAGVTVALPVAPPLHKTFVCAVMAAVSAAGSVIVAVAVVVHPLASVTVTVFVFAARAAAVVSASSVVGSV